MPLELGNSSEIPRILPKITCCPSMIFAAKIWRELYETSSRLVAQLNDCYLRVHIALAFVAARQVRR